MRGQRWGKSFPSSQQNTRGGQLNDCVHASDDRLDFIHRHVFVLTTRTEQVLDEGVVAKMRAPSLKTAGWVREGGKSQKDVCVYLELLYLPRLQTAIERRHSLSHQPIPFLSPSSPPILLTPSLLPSPHHVPPLLALIHPHILSSSFSPTPGALWNLAQQEGGDEKKEEEAYYTFVSAHMLRHCGF